jgi:L-lysine 6-transaminase
MWAFEQSGVTPDILVFGKKMQVCGIIATARIDEEPDNVFHVSSRINSTWGGSLVDMVRATRYLEIIQEEQLLENVKKVGKILLEKINSLQLEYPDYISNVRGKGFFCAFDVRETEIRNKLREKCFKEGLLILPCGDKSLRFRPPLNLSEEKLNEGFDIIINSAKKVF